MVPALEKISETLLPAGNAISAEEKWREFTQRFPWYPLPWLMLALPGDAASIKKASLWFPDEQRLLYVLNQQVPFEDNWVSEQLLLLKKNGNPGSSSVVEPAAISIKEESEEIPEPEIVSEVLLMEEKTIGNTNTLKEQPEQAELVANTVTDSPPEEERVIPPLRMNYDPTAPARAAPLFEPYYAVDYFASLGIKLKAGTLSQDKFDTQLKSFTQWLKTMKKVSDTAPAYADPMVEAQAVASNAGKEVVTEAMAQVLEKQGSFDKAAGIYEKLLLLHPEKGALFAARIADLKTKQ